MCSGQLTMAIPLFFPTTQQYQNKIAETLCQVLYMRRRTWKKNKIDDKRQCIYSRNAMECRFAFNRLIGWMNLHEHGAPQNVMLYKTTAQSTMLFVDSVSTQNRCSNSTKEHKHQRITKYDQTTPQIPRSLMKYASAHQPQTMQKLFPFFFWFIWVKIFFW